MWSSQDTFRRQLKTHYFSKPSNSLSVSLLAPQIQPWLTTVHVYKLFLLTYLLTYTIYITQKTNLYKRLHPITSDCNCTYCRRLRPWVSAAGCQVGPGPPCHSLHSPALYLHQVFTQLSISCRRWTTWCWMSLKSYQLCRETQLPQSECVMLHVTMNRRTRRPSKLCTASVWQVDAWAMRWP